MLIILNRETRPDGSPSLAVNGAFDQPAGDPPRQIQVRIEAIIAPGQETLWKATLKPASAVRRALTQLEWSLPEPGNPNDTTTIHCRTFDTVAATAYRMEKCAANEAAYWKNDRSSADRIQDAAAELDQLFPPIPKPLPTMPPSPSKTANLSC